MWILVNLNNNERENNEGWTNYLSVWGCSNKDRVPQKIIVNVPYILLCVNISKDRQKNAFEWIVRVGLLKRDGGI